MKPLIIIGGMGPQASLHLHGELLKESLKHHSGNPEEFPLILHASIPVPDFIGSTEKLPKARQTIQAVLQQLPLESAHAIGLACNTAHTMTRELDLERENFISMLRETAQQAQAAGIKKVGLLASPHTIHTKLYVPELTRHGLEVIVPTKTELQAAEQIIRAVIAGQDPERLRPRLTKIATQLVSRGADGIVLGCTELPLVGMEPLDLPVIDSISALAQAMIKAYY